jgi:DNA-binding MurR/RpiR family transcriptional regulator
MSLAAPTTLQFLHEAIGEQFPLLTAQEQLVGKFIVDNPTKVALLSMRKLAALSNVSPYTVIRFFKKFGFAKFDDLKELSATALTVDPVATLQMAQLKMNATPNVEPGGMLATQLGLILSAISNPDAAELDRLAGILTRAKVNYVLGFRASQALAQHFHYCGQHAHKNMLFISGAESYAIDQIAGIGSGDVLVALSFKPYAQLTVRLCQFAKSKGARVVALTDSKLSPLFRLADESVFVPADGPSYFNSMVAPTIVLERLLVRMHKLNDDQAASRLIAHRNLHKYLDRQR